MEDSLPLFAFESLKFTNAGLIIFASEKDGHNHLYSIAATGGASELLLVAASGGSAPSR